MQFTGSPASLTRRNRLSFSVATRNTKGGYYTCTKNDTYVNCACNSCKHDSVCKHSISNSIKEQIIESHLQRFQPSDRASRAGLVQENSSPAGKKGSRNKNPWRVARSGKSKDQHTSMQAPAELIQLITTTISHSWCAFWKRCQKQRNVGSAELIS